MAMTTAPEHQLHQLHQWQQRERQHPDAPSAARVPASSPSTPPPSPPSMRNKFKWWPSIQFVLLDACILLLTAGGTVALVARAAPPIPGVGGWNAAVAAATVRRLEEVEIELSWDMQRIGELEEAYGGMNGAFEEASGRSDALRRQPEESQAGTPDSRDQSPRQQQHQPAMALLPSDGAGGLASASRDGGDRYRQGDVVEIFNDESTNLQIVFPAIVKKRARSRLGGGCQKGSECEVESYHLSKSTDGRELPNIEARHLHPYRPYVVGSKALCNIGDFERSRFVRCTVKEYIPPDAGGARVLQGQYNVAIHAAEEKDNFETTLPVWKMQRQHYNLV